MGASEWVMNAGRLFAVCALAALASTAAEDHHAPRHHQRRSLQSSSSIVFINAIAGTPFTSAEEDAVQLQVTAHTVFFSPCRTITAAVLHNKLEFVIVFLFSEYLSQHAIVVPWASRSVFNYLLHNTVLPCRLGRT